MPELKPCRFCGETKKLSLDRGVWETTWGIDADGQVIRDPSGEPTTDVELYRDHHNIDQVNCEVCEVMMPLRVWNSTSEFMAAMVANIAAADAEYDDDGVWHAERRAA